MMASRMLKGSMVYTTKMMKRKNDTYAGKKSMECQKIPVPFTIKGGRKQHAHLRNSITAKQGRINSLDYNKDLSLGLVSGVLGTEVCGPADKSLEPRKSGSGSQRLL